MSDSLTNAMINDACESLHTILDFIRWSASRCEASDLCYGHGTDNPWDESFALVLAALNLPADTQDPNLLNCRVTQEEKALICDWLSKRINERKPLAYLTGRMTFAGLPFKTDERALVPRSPIAELCESQFMPWFNEPPMSILDLCTGGGCIALASSWYNPDAEVTGSDLSTDALSLAEENAEALGLSGHVEFVHSDLFEALEGRTFDLIVSNPPYVDLEDMTLLADEFKHEPAMGLASGTDGLDITRRILSEAASHLNPGGILIVEVGNSAPAVDEAFPELPLTWVEFERGGEGVFMVSKEELEMAS